MKTMKKGSVAVFSLFASAAFFCQSASAQLRTSPASPAEIETLYTSSIESRTEDILKPLALTNVAKSNKVHDLIIAQYRVMRSRDELINARLEAEGKELTYANRASQIESETKTLHDYFIAQLAKVLSAEDVEKIKDKMTYNKVKITYEAYNAIVPALTDSDKAKITELLKAAREKAIDGGSASEKSDIFKVYKNQINDYLIAQGHDVAKAYKDWEAKQALAKAAGTSTSTNTNTVQ